MAYGVGVVTSRDGTQIRWHRAGDGPPAVLVHGTCGDRGNWIACTPHLSGRLTLYAIDRRGRGTSGDGPAYSIEREYEDVAAVVEAIGEPVTLIGHSYGAIVSLGATRLTGGIARLILYEPPLLVQRYYDCEEWAARIDRHLEVGDRSAAALAFLERAATAEESTRLRAHPPAWKQIERDAHTVPRELRSLRSMGAGRFDDLTLRALLLVGEHTPRYLRASVEHLAAMLPSARTVELPAQGHLAQAFAPELFCAQVLLGIGNAGFLS